MSHPVASEAANSPSGRLCVLKFGSSVLAEESDFPKVVHEIYRHVRDGEKVVAVVSALAGQTDALLNQARRVGRSNAPDALVARVARVGELHSAALLALSLARFGLRATTLDPHEMGLVAEGRALDSNLVDVDASAVWSVIDEHDVVVVPGFIASHAEHGLVTLGRGGTDLSAVFFADRLDAHRVRLIKDVDGVYDEDPAKNPFAHRFSQMGYEEAAEASSGLIQEKAIHLADEKDVLIEIAAMGSAEATTIARLSSEKSCPPRPEKLRVALLGYGSVGGGVLPLLLDQPELFDVGPVLVRAPSKRSGDHQFTNSLEEALSGNPDLVIELMGGTDIAADALHRALASGAQVITANKAAVAKHWDSLHASAASSGGALRFSSAVGGGTPVIEMLRRLKGEVVELEAVTNGTTNYLLCRLAEGWSFDDAMLKAQELGYAEADPSADIDGIDAASKLSILVREAFGIALPPELVSRESMRDLTPQAIADAGKRGEVWKQVARARLKPDGTVAGEVVLLSLPVSHPLAKVHDEENRFLVRDRQGKVHDVFGKGAGRWPTATAVFADVMDAQRALLGREPVQRAQAPMRVSA